MTTLQRISLVCPVCERRFETQAVVSTNKFGGTRTDFHERAAGMQPLPFLIHMCSMCGFAGTERDFNDSTQIEAKIKERVHENLESLTEGAISGSEKYEAAAKVANWREYEARHVADLYLRAAWCAVDEGDIEAERYYRRQSAFKFEEAIDSFDGIEAKERAVFTYLVGEIWRRVGDLKQAASWFNRVAGEVIDPPLQEWVAKAAIQQRDCPREWFG